MLQIKLSMVSTLTNLNIDENLPNKLNIWADVVSEKQLLDLMTNKTLKLFVALDIQTKFLQTDSSTWDTNKEFIIVKKKFLSRIRLNRARNVIHFFF